MTKLNELEYKALNIMDEIVTVEVAFEPIYQTIHVFDTKMAVEPEYNFAKKGFELSDAFYKMADILHKKGYVEVEGAQSFESWVQAIRWCFYSSKQTIKVFEGNENKIIPLGELVQHASNALNDVFYGKYVKKLH